MRGRTKNEGQLTLSELLEEEPGKLHKLAINPDDIGGELLAVLTKGLYTNPMDCIREYVQNAVDAGAKNVKIKITGNSVNILDDGRGMNLEDLLQARQFGLSFKFVVEHVGFRGIGIYSGFDLCRRLRIISTKENDPYLHVLVFEFAEMKARLEQERRDNSGLGKTSIIRLLSEHTYIKREQADTPLERGYTLIQLEEINEFHIRNLSNRAELKKYLLQNLPIDFSDSFAHKDAINQKLSILPGYTALKVTLESDGLDDEIVDKYADIDLQAPTFGYIQHPSTKAQIAYYWACLNSNGQRIDDSVPPQDRPKYEGFVYKVKGFTIGDRNNLREMFAKRMQLYNWYTGEIYILDPGIIPNAERNDFESGQAKQALEIALREKSNDFISAALGFQQEERAKDVLDKSRKEFASIETSLAGVTEEAKNSSYEDDYKLYSRLDDIIDELKKHRRKLDAQRKQYADELMEKAKRVQKQLVKDLDSETPQSTRQKRDARKTITTQLPLNGVSPPPAKTLPNVLTSCGWTLDGELLALVEVIQSSLEDVLTMGSSAYRTLLTQIESKLTDNGIDE